MIDIQQYAPPVVATSAIRLAARLGLANRVDPVVNVIISNVPGPRQPLYLGRAKLDQYIPVSTIAEGMGLNITVHSYLDELDLRPDRLPRAGARPVAHGRPARRRDRRAVQGDRRRVRRATQSPPRRVVARRPAAAKKAPAKKRAPAKKAAARQGDGPEAGTGEEGSGKQGDGPEAGTGEEGGSEEAGWRRPASSYNGRSPVARRVEPVSV